MNNVASDVINCFDCSQKATADLLENMDKEAKRLGALARGHKYQHEMFAVMDEMLARMLRKNAEAVEADQRPAYQPLRKYKQASSTITITETKTKK